jgi:hypothetical protein
MVGFAQPALSTNSPQISKQLTASDQALIKESRQSIIETGLSESYFDSHFKVIRVENKTSDRRVVWQLTINGYQAVITDSIGYYTEGSARINTHNVKQLLGRTTDIVKTISNSQALKRMRACIGVFAEPSVQFGSVEGVAELLMVAQKKETLSRREREERERREAREREREREKEKASNKNTRADEIENEGEEGEGEPVLIGYINLRTGKCTKGKGVMTP